MNEGENEKKDAITFSFIINFFSPHSTLGPNSQIFQCWNLWTIAAIYIGSSGAYDDKNEVQKVKCKIR